MTKSLNKAVWHLCAITVDMFQVFKAYERHDSPPSIVILWYINALMWHLAIAVSLMQQRLAATEHWCMKVFLKLLSFQNDNDSGQRRVALTSLHLSD